MKTFQSIPDLTFALLPQGQGHSLLAAKDYNAETHGQSTLLCPECYQGGHSVMLHYVRPYSRTISMKALDALTHAQKGQVISEYSRPPSFACNPGQGGHQCVIPKRGRNLKAYAHKKGSWRKNTQERIYVFEARIPFGDARDWTRLRPYSGPDRLRYQVEPGPERVHPNNRGLLSAQDMADFFLNPKLDLAHMCEQSLWDGAQLRKAGDVLSANVPDLVRAGLMEALSRPRALIFTPIGLRRKWREYAHKLAPEADGRAIPGQAAHVHHRGKSLQPSIVLSFGKAALYERACEILNRAGTRAISAMLVWGRVEFDGPAFDAKAESLRRGEVQADGLKQGFGLRVRIDYDAQIAPWDGPQDKALLAPSESGELFFGGLRA